MRKAKLKYQRQYFSEKRYGGPKKINILDTSSNLLSIVNAILKNT